MICEEPYGHWRQGVNDNAGFQQRCANWVWTTYRRRPPHGAVALTREAHMLSSPRLGRRSDIVFPGNQAALGKFEPVHGIRNTFRSRGKVHAGRRRGKPRRP